MRATAKNLSPQSVHPAADRSEAGSASFQNARERLVDYLAAQWKELLRLRREVLENFEQEAIHDLRVASRRLRSALAVLPPLLGKKRIRRLSRPLRKLTRELGELRNLDEAQRYLRTLEDDGLAPLTTQLGRQRYGERRRIRQLLHELPVKRLSRRLQKLYHLLDSAPPEQLPGWLSAHNLALYRPIQDLLQLEGLADQPTKRHRLRIAIKKWRYFTELLTQLGTGHQQMLLRRLKRYQTLLGDLNDREVFLQMVGTATCLAAASRERAQHLIVGQHRRLVSQFRQLLHRQPLQYQCMLHEESV